MWPAPEGLMVANESVLFSRLNAIREMPMHQNGGINALDYSLSVGRKGNQHHTYVSLACTLNAHSVYFQICYSSESTNMNVSPSIYFIVKLTSIMSIVRRQRHGFLTGKCIFVRRVFLCQQISHPMVTWNTSSSFMPKAQGFELRGPDFPVSNWHWRYRYICL